MATILESDYNCRRTVRLSSEDVISIVREYQRITYKCSDIEEVRDRLKDSIIYIPEDI